jgi:hypothetical protein
MEKQFCEVCDKYSTCKKICDKLEKHLKETCGGNHQEHYHREETQNLYDWCGGQDKDFIDANLGWD